MRVLTTLVLAAGLLASVGCATAPPPGSPFKQLIPPAPGKARLYVLRPQYTSMRGSEKPLLLIDAKPVVALEFDQYVDISIDAGRRLLALQPGAFDRNEWRRELTLDVQAGSTYFVALWANLVPQGGSMLLPLPGGWLFPLRTNEARLAEVRFEEVSADDALEALKTLVRVPQPSLTAEQL